MAQLLTAILQRLQGLFLRFPSLLIIIISLLYARSYFLEPLQVGANGSGCRMERFAVLGLDLLGVVLQMLEDEACMSVKQEV